MNLDLRESGRADRSLLVDLTDGTQIAAAMAEIGERHDAIDAVVNSTRSPASARSMNWDGRLTRVTVIQLTGAMLVCKCALPLMFSSGGGVVNVAGSYGMMGGARTGPIVSSRVPSCS